MPAREAIPEKVQDLRSCERTEKMSRSLTQDDLPANLITGQEVK